ncbi:MAG: PorT family protein [Bryobacteraceae bacterium]|nr:PorT family protein [Bryobacteraceae bacterium]
MLRNCYHAGGLIVLAAAILFPAQAQEKQQAFHRKFEVGFRVGYMPLKLMRKSDATTSYTSFVPPLEVKARSFPQERPVTGGGSLVYRFNDKWGAGVDALYRKVGYDELVITQTIVESGQTAVPYGYTSERTRAAFWDVPVLLRYTKYQQRGIRPRVTGMIGPSMRFVKGIDSYREFVNKNANVTQTSTPITPASKMTPGATAGLGISWQDEIGVKFSVEGRYTRWQKDAFRNGPTVSTRNTVEVLVGFSF